MSIDPLDVLQVSISTGGHIPCIDECREIIRQVDSVECLIEKFLQLEIDAEEYLDGVDDAGVDMDDYTLWLPTL
ncbi:MAG: hypothetical protein KME40_32050 [Komarekiella atlantica HA4396-MV6]|jgi:hypothetical protein|nr:hypothetical protein [Komarekiella atlantica HA4396-MV6]